MNDKPGTVFITGIDGKVIELEFDHIDPRDSYVFCCDRVDTGIKARPVQTTNRRYFPWSRVLEIQRPPYPTEQALQDVSEDSETEMHVASDGGDIL